MNGNAVTNVSWMPFDRMKGSGDPRYSPNRTTMNPNHHPVSVANKPK